MHYHDVHIAEVSSPFAIACAPSHEIGSAVSNALHYHEAHCADPAEVNLPVAAEACGGVFNHCHEAHLGDAREETQAVVEDADPLESAVGHYHDACIAQMQPGWVGEVALVTGETYAEALAREVGKLRSVYQEMAEGCRRAAAGRIPSGIRAA